MEYIKFDEIICSTIKLIKNCPDDFINLKYDIMTRLRTLILCKRDTNQPNFERTKQATLQLMTQNALDLIEDDMIINKNISKSSLIQRNSFYHLYCEIVKSVI